MGKSFLFLSKLGPTVWLLVDLLGIQLREVFAEEIILEFFKNRVFLLRHGLKTVVAVFLGD